MTRTAAHSFLCAVALCAAAASSSAQNQKQASAEKPGVTRRDSAGIAIVDNAYPAPARRAPFTVDTTALMRIGSETDTLYRFGKVADARVLRSGTIVVGEDVEERLRFYSRFGVFTKLAGGRNLDQGGFTTLQSLEARADTLIACCSPGVSLFTSAGTFIRATAPFKAGLLGVVQNGRFLVRRSTDEASAYQGQKGVVKSLLMDTLFFVDRAGTFGGRVATLPSRVHVSVFNPDPNPLGLTITYLESPFETESYYATAGAGFYFTDGRRMQVSQYSAAGRVTRIIRLDIPQTALTAALGDRYKQAILRKYTNEATRRYIEWVLGQYVLPDRLPLVRALKVAADGRIWLREHAFPVEDQARWHVFATDGAYEGVVQLPSRWRVHQIDADVILVSESTPSGRENVSLHKLVPTAAR